jgi:hypothetical protein
MRHVKTLIGTVALAAACASCGDVVREGKSPMFLVMDSLVGSRGGTNDPFGNPVHSDVTTKGSIFSDPGRAVLRVLPKNIGTPATPAAPSSNNEVTVTRYRVVYKRADGRNTPGVDVPYSFDGAVTGTIVPGSGATLTFDLVRYSAKMEAPLAHLQNEIVVLNVIADVTLFGRDRVGNEISVTGSIQIDFANFGDPA